ncbi:protein NYNRIN-like [Papaver somniferum]|uniref:protein NYNRIN-like n=1 Tax=Papaver somniferum TaxID=3469 RepID=UPI000E6F5B97|nr:protein NYNRIN-like [Papaver somniferum]
MSSKRHKYIITATKYASKWVEAIPLKDYAGDTVAAFIKKHIIYRFGAPMIIRADNAKSFVNKDVIDLLRQYNIRLHTSTPYYPKGNGQAKATNKMLIWILSKAVHDHHIECHEQLPLALWAYRISKRISTVASPYSLVYGEYAILPTEIAIPSARVAMASHTTPDEISRFAHLDTIEERRARAERFSEAYRKRATNYYNQGVRERAFKVDELVLKIAPHVQRNTSAEKFAANWEGPFMVRKVAESGYYKVRRMNGIEVKTPINGKWLKKIYA